MVFPKERYEHFKMVYLPKACNDWQNLRFQDFKSVQEYNSELFKKVSVLCLCEKTVTEGMMLEETFTTFHARDVILQQQYIDKNFTKFYELISWLLIAEQNNELLMQNHQSRLSGLALLPENNYRQRRWCGCGNGYKNHEDEDIKKVLDDMVVVGNEIISDHAMANLTYINKNNKTITWDYKQKEILVIVMDWKAIGPEFTRPLSILSIFIKNYAKIRRIKLLRQILLAISLLPPLKITLLMI